MITKHSVIGKGQTLQCRIWFKHELMEVVPKEKCFACDESKKKNLNIFIELFGLSEEGADFAWCCKPCARSHLMDIEDKL